MQPAPPRRQLIVLLAVFALATTAGCAGGTSVEFTHGVASGDVRSDGAGLWTRVDRRANLALEVATDAAFSDIVADQDVPGREDHDFTARAQVTGLQPSTTYYYRFRRAATLSDTGTFRTAPAEDDAAPVRFVFSGDSDGTVRADGTQAFDFRVLDAARAEDPDFFVYLGDTIYADSEYGTKAVSLDGFRAKYKENREVPPLRALLGSTSAYATWDDHEVENDFAGATVSPDLLAAGRQAFREYLPIAGDNEPEVLYRRFRWGKAVDLIILDGRSFRDENAAAACTPPGASGPDILPGLGAPGVPDAYRALRTVADLPPETDAGCLAALNSPSRTMLGEAQKQFLLGALEQSDAMFKFVINPEPIAELVAQPYDRWEGYRAERDEVLRFLGDRGIRNVVFLSADFHANIISDVRVNLASLPVAVEAITGPIGHDTLGDDIAQQQGEQVILVFEQLLYQIPRVACAELDAFSYGLVEVDPSAGTATITLKDENGAELCQKIISAQ